jgi:hypothetical protein
MKALLTICILVLIIVILDITIFKGNLSKRVSQAIIMDDIDDDD